MPIGVTINSLAVLVGGLLGSKFGRFLPERTRQSLSMLFGYCSIAIGITLIPKVNALPAMMLALIVGTILGEGLRLEDRVVSGMNRIKTLAERRMSHKDSEIDDAYITRLVGLLILFCTGSTGILGALTEGLTGVYTLLLTKAVMDGFGSFSFAAAMGAPVALIAIPQFVLLSILFFLAEFIMPLISPTMLADFMACGGVIAVITGVRIAEIKHMRVTNMLPALILVHPISYLWGMLF